MKLNKLEMMLPFLFVYVILIVSAIVFQNPAGPPFDLPQLYCSARLELSGQFARIYDPYLLGREAAETFKQLNGDPVTIYIPPFAAQALAPLGLLPANLVGPIWLSVLVLFLVLSLFIASKIYGFGNRFVLWQGVFLIFFGPAFEAFRHNQITAVSLFSLMLFVLAWKRDFKVCAALALTVLSAKPQQLIPLVALLLGAREYKILAALAGCLACLILVSLLTFGLTGWNNYLQLCTYSVSHIQWMAPQLGPTLRGQFLLLFPQQREAVSAICLGVMLVSFVTIIYVTARLRHSDNFKDRSLIFALILGLVSALHAHNYDVLLLLPAFWSASVLGLFEQAKHWIRSVVAVCIAVFVIPFYTFIHYFYLVRGGVINPFFVSLTALSILAYLSVRQRLPMLRSKPSILE
jgi:hypothetical protein